MTAQLLHTLVIIFFSKYFLKRRRYTIFNNLKLFELTDFNWEKSLADHVKFLWCDTIKTEVCRFFTQLFIEINWNYDSCIIFYRIDKQLINFLLEWIQIWEIRWLWYPLFACYYYIIIKQSLLILYSFVYMYYDFKMQFHNQCYSIKSCVVLCYALSLLLLLFIVVACCLLCIDSWRKGLVAKRLFCCCCRNYKQKICK